MSAQVVYLRTTGYAGRIFSVNGSNTGANKTCISGVYLSTAWTAGTRYNATIRLTRGDALDVVHFEVSGRDTTGVVFNGFAELDVAGNMDIIRLTTDNGTDTFDSGESTLIVRVSGRAQGTDIA